MPTHDDLTVQAFPLGPYATNCMVVAPSDSSECWIIDASFQPGEMLAYIRDKGLNPTHTILTHCHVDHIGGLNEVRAAFPDTKVLVHADEVSWFTDTKANLSEAFGVPVTCAPPDQILNHGDTLTLGDRTFSVRHTPGHSPGSISLVCPEVKLALVGDALFAGSIGRTDFPTANTEVLLDSIRTHLYTLPPETTCYPGHGPTTTIGVEMTTNPFVRA